MTRMALIGCGSMGTVFVRQMAALDDRLQFTALVDIDPERAAKTADAAGGDAKATTDYHDVLDDFDAAIVALPHDIHFEVVSELLRAGKHVLVEKPLALTERQCLDLVRMSEEDGSAVLMVGYIMRFHALWTEMGRLIREQVYGPCFQVSVWTEQYTDTSRGAWLGQAARVGGGQLFSHGCHYIDLLLHWLGAPEQGTHTGTNLGTPWMEMEGTSNVAMRFAGGTLAYHFGTWGARGSRLRYAVHAHCTGGMLELRHGDGVIRLWRDPSGGDLPALEHDLPDGGRLESPRSAVIHECPEAGSKNAVAEVAHFLDCIATGSRPETHARMATQSLRLIWRLYDAEHRGVVADLRGLGLDAFSPDPDPVLAQTKRFGYGRFD